MPPSAMHPSCCINSLCIEHRREADNQLVTVRVGGKCDDVLFEGEALSIS